MSELSGKSAIQHSHIWCKFLSRVASVIQSPIYEHMNQTPLVMQDAAPGALDDSVEVLLLLMDRDLFGDTADAKEAANFAANYKEAKSCRAYDTYRLLASMITFRSHMRILMSTVRVVARVWGARVWGFASLKGSYRTLSVGY